MDEVEIMRGYMAKVIENDAKQERKKVIKLFDTYFRFQNDTINDDPVVNADGTVSLFDTCYVRIGVKFDKLPITFKEVQGSFNCDGCGLITLEGCPEVVSGNFSCQDNDLTSLIGSPKIVGASFRCQNNTLRTLEGLPEGLRVFRGTWHSSLPILRVLKCSRIMFHSDTLSVYAIKINTILAKYCGDKFSRSNIIACQKELIDSGFEGNASW